MEIAHLDAFWLLFEIRMKMSIALCGEVGFVSSALKERE